MTPWSGLPARATPNRRPTKRGLRHALWPPASTLG